MSAQETSGDLFAPYSAIQDIREKVAKRMEDVNQKLLPADERLSKLAASVAVYSLALGHAVQDEFDSLIRERNKAQQLAMRQANEIRKLQRNGV